MITLIIIGITIVISVLCFQNEDLFMKLRFSPYMVKSQNQTYRFFTHAFVHVDWMHLFINMFVLYSFGTAVESYFGFLFASKGIVYFIILYIGGILFSSLPAFGKHQLDPYYSSVGASGAVCAVLFSGILIQPWAGIGIIFLPFHIPAFIFGPLYLIYEAYGSKKLKDNIGHDAHLWGAIFGIVITLIFDYKIGIGFIEQIKNYF